MIWLRRVMLALFGIGKGADYGKSTNSEFSWRIVGVVSRPYSGLQKENQKHVNR